jgi:hypothetical protein
VVRYRTALHPVKKPERKYGILFEKTILYGIANNHYFVTK